MIVYLAADLRSVTSVPSGNRAWPYMTKTGPDKGHDYPFYSRTGTPPTRLMMTIFFASILPANRKRKTNVASWKHKPNYSLRKENAVEDIEILVPSALPSHAPTARSFEVLLRQQLVSNGVSDAYRNLLSSVSSGHFHHETLIYQLCRPCYSRTRGLPTPCRVVQRHVHRLFDRRRLW